MKSTSSNRNKKAAPNNDFGAFDTALRHDPSVPAPEVVRRLGADMARVFYNSPADIGDEAEPNQNGISPAIDSSVQVCRLLNQCLANCIDLRLQCKQLQWEMDGTYANALARLYAQTAAAIEQYADRLATRIIALGGVADGRLDTVAEQSGLSAYPHPVMPDVQPIDAVASTLAVMIGSLRSEFAAMAERCDSQTRELLEQLLIGLESHRARMQAQP